MMIILARYSLFSFGLLGTVLTGSVLAQDNVRDEIFKDVLESFDQAEEMNATILSPKNYSEARKHLVKAQNRFDEGDKLETVREDLSKAAETLKKAMTVAELGQVALKDVLAVRAEVLESGLLFDNSKEFQEAEKKLEEAAEKLEKDDLKGARKPSSQASDQYRKAVLKVLEKDVLSDAREKLKESKNSLSKEAYKQAEKVLENLERQVKSQKNQDFAVAELASSITMSIDQVFSEAGIGSAVE